MDFWRVTAILNKRKWLILLSVFASGALAAGATQFIGSKWVATVQFLKPERLPGTDGAAIYGTSAESDAVVYDSLIRSQGVLRKFCIAMGMNQPPPNFLKNVTFEHYGPRMFLLHVTDTSAARSEKMANTLASVFIDVYHTQRTAQLHTSIKQLDKLTRESTAKLDMARQQYDNYRAKHNIVSTLNDSVDTALMHYSRARQKREDILEKVASVRAQLHDRQTALAKLPTHISIIKAPEANPMVTRLQDDLAKAEEELTTLRERYTEGWPQVQKAIINRDALREKLKKATAHQSMGTTVEQPNPDVAVLQQQMSLLNQDIVACEAQLKTLDSAVQASSTEIDKFRGIDSPMSALAADVAQQFELRAGVAARLNNARLLLDAFEQQNPITISDPVGDFNPPQDTTPGRALKIILMAALGALLCTSGLAIAFDSVDNRLKTVKEAEIVLPTGVIAAIPGPQGPISYSDMARVSELQPSSLQAESYRFLGLHLLRGAAPGVKSLMVLSAKAEQGSTTAISNLAITLAQAGKRVVLVDANIRTAELHTVFNLPNKFGYADLLQNPTGASLERAMHATTVENLSVITTGPTPDNPWQLFRSESLHEVSRRLQGVADYILYDTPSALLFTDAMNLAPVVDAAFLSVRALQPLSGGEQRIIDQLEQANVTVLGAVLNDVPAALLEGYRNYHEYYVPAAREAAAAAALTAGEASGRGSAHSLFNADMSNE